MDNRIAVKAPFTLIIKVVPCMYTMIIFELRENIKGLSFKVAIFLFQIFNKSFVLFYLRLMDLGDSW